jgi:hypothetical protein
MKLTVSEVGVLFLLLFAVFHFLKIFATLRAVLVFLGVVVTGSAGWLGRVLGDIGTWAQHAFGSITGWAVGISLAAGLFIILAVVFIHDLHPRNSAGKRTGWIGVALGVLVVVGVAGIPALGHLRTDILNALGSAVGTVNSASGR